MVSSYFRSSGFRRGGRALLAIAALLAVAVTLAWAFTAVGQQHRPAGDPPGSGRLGAGSLDSTHGDLAGQLRTGPATELVFDTAGRCRHVERWIEAAGAARAGLDPRALETALPGWSVTSFSAARVHLRPTGGGDCPDTRPFTLAIRDGEVVIIAGPDPEGPIEARPGIPASVLAPGDLALLRSGYTVEGLDRAWEYLEGIAEHQAP